MSRLFNIHPFYAPVETPASGGSKSTTLPESGNKEDMIEFMAGDDDDKPEVIDLPAEKPKKEKPSEIPDDDDRETSDDETSEEEVDELAELEDELEEPSEEQLELVTPARRKDILKKYPQVFKDFPYLEKAYYREQQFTELLPTIEDAKTAVEKSSTLDRFEADLMGGNSSTILQAVKETNPRAFLKMVDDYLPTLHKVDEKAYFHVIGNLTKHTIISMVNEAKRTNNEQLQTAAHLLQQFVFGTSDFVPPKNLAGNEKPEDNTREKQITEREQTFIKQQFDNTRVDLNSRVNNTLRNTIDANIDPKKSMSDYVRKNASRDALDTLESAINQDTRFRVLVDKLWDKAFESNFSRESTDRIKSAYVSKARTLLPSVIKKARNEAMRGMGKRVKDDDTEETTPSKGPVKQQGQPRSQSENTGKSTKTSVPSGMSTLDFLNS